MWICKGSLSAILSVHCLWHYVERSLPTESLLVFTHRPLQWSTHVQAHRRERASFIFILRVISNLLAVFTLILQGPCFHPVPVSPPILHTPTHMQIPTVSPSEAFSRCEERLGSETWLTEGCRAAVQFECVCTCIKMNTFNTSVCIIIVFHLQRQTAQNTNSASVCRRSAQLNTNTITIYQEN